MTIHFVCRGNAFRSIIAEAYLKSQQIPGLEVVSSGTSSHIYRPTNDNNFQLTLKLLRKHGLEKFAKPFHGEQLHPDRLKKSDVVVCLNQKVYDEYVEQLDAPNRVYVWDVSDIGEKGRVLELGQDRSEYEEDVYEEIKANVDRLILELRLAQ